MRTSQSSFSPIEKIVDKAKSFYGQRVGQSYMNALRSLRPDLYNKIKGTDFDCFYDDSKVPLFVSWIMSNWGTIDITIDMEVDGFVLW